MRLFARAAAASLALAASLGLAALDAGCAGTHSFAAAAPATGGLAASGIETPRKLEWAEPVQNVIALSGDIYIAGQPSEAALKRFKAEGVTVVINLRTPPEVADRQQVPYDEPALAKELGLDYVSVPVGGKEWPASPAAVDAVARALAAHQGKALLHCTVGHRASHMWAAFLVRHRGVAPAEAVERARAVMNNRPLWADLIDAEVVAEPRSR